MRIAILCGGDGWHVRDLLRAAHELGHEAVPVDFRRVSATEPEVTLASKPPALDRFESIIVRTMPPGSLEQVVFRMDLLHAAELRGVNVLNPPRALETCVDKYLALVRLRAAGLRVPETVVCQQADAAIDAFESLGGDVVVKPIFGSEGHGMIRITDRELAWRTFRAIERTQSILYVQRFIAHPGWDLRAFVLNGRVLAAMRRVSKGDWRTNVAQGAIAEPVTLTAEQESLALRASSAVGAIAAGVDLLPGNDGNWYVIEVNAVPGWKALGPATGIDVARSLIEAVGIVESGVSCRAESMSEYARLACLWEATARKAGNVHPEASFSNLTYADFVRSALAAAPEIGRAANRPLGATILAAIRATRAVVATNTNLGIVLLLAPLAKVIDCGLLRAELRQMLDATTIADALEVYEAIRMAEPGAMGTVQEQDIRSVPSVPLREVMALAAERDLIARQYANDFADVLNLGLPSLLDGMRRFGRLEPAIQHCQLTWLANHPDSLILRKCGPEIAAEASRRARNVLELGSVADAAGRAAYADFDRWLRADGHARNPGTTADLVTACLFAALRERRIDSGAQL
jgi:ribosomal protein S6--L-glutamate ligase